MRKGLSLSLVAALVTACTSHGGSSPTAHGAAANRITIDLHALSIGGPVAMRSAMKRSLVLLEDRLKAAHVTSQIAREGVRGIRITTVGSSDASVAATLATTRGILRFRQVLAVGSPAQTSGSGPLPQAASPDLRLAENAFARYHCKPGSSLTHGLDSAADYIVACDRAGAAKYLLAPSALAAGSVTYAHAVQDSIAHQWLVLLTFSSAARSQWYELTKRAYEADPSQSPTTCQIGHATIGCNEIAMVIDGVVVSAPSVQQDGIRGGQTQITGEFTRREAKALAIVLRTGPLPLRFDVG